MKNTNKTLYEVIKLKVCKNKILDIWSFPTLQDQNVSDIEQIRDINKFMVSSSSQASEEEHQWFSNWRQKRENHEASV